MPLQATSGAASYDAFGGGVPVVPNYIEDVFSTYLYTGTGSAQTITNGIDLSTKGGLVWCKSRSSSISHGLSDTVTGRTKALRTNNFASQVTTNDSITSFNNNGFSLGTDLDTGWFNTNLDNYVWWTLRKQPKFFDVVTWTGSGSNRTIAHSLGSVPACIIVKRRDDDADWQVYHRSLANTEYLVLNTAAAKATGATRWNSTTPTSAVFSLGTDATVNASGGTYVAYLFAHDAGGFGLTGTDNVISCGSFDGTANTDVALGYEPQWIMFKNTTSASNWQIVDNMRGMFVGSADKQLMANLSNAESDNNLVSPTATGFTWIPSAAGNTYIYIAIRRGPMRVPTSGTSVYQANAYTGNATANTTVAGNFGFPVDLMLLSSRSANALGWADYGQVFLDRLRGSNVSLGTGAAGGEDGGWSSYNAFDVKNSIGWGLYGANSGTAYFNNSGGTWVARGFGRAPAFFDEVCYSGTGTATTQTHNLGVVPELMIIKQRSGSQNWPVYVSSIGATKIVVLSSTAAEAVNSCFNDTTPTASVFSINNSVQTNGSGSTYVAWLFATLAGVSKVGSYTGNGSSQTINCGFTGGARFVMVKATSTTGNWIVADSARGIVAGNDPALYLNSTAAEVTGLDWIDADNSGFVVNETATIAANTNGVSYIFFAVA